MDREARVQATIAEMAKAMEDDMDDDPLAVWNGPWPRHDLIGQDKVFKEWPTSEPGLTMTCQTCAAMFYVEGIVSSTISTTGIGEPLTVMPHSCPMCGGHMRAQEHILNLLDGGVSVTHPAFLPLALEELVRQLQDGELTAEQALSKLRSTPTLSPIAKWVEARGASISILVSVLLFAITYLAPPGSNDEPPLSPDQMAQVIEHVLDGLDEREKAEQPAVIPPSADLPAKPAGP